MVGNTEKKDCLEVFNSISQGVPVSFQDKLLPMVSEYLTENNIENSDKMINLIVQNPQTIQNFIPEVIDFYSRKFNILNIKYNNKIILYYE